MYYKYNIRTEVQKMNAKVRVSLSSLAVLFGGGLMAVAVPVAVHAAAPTSKGFDANGYNYNARTFSGLADGVDKTLDGKVWGDPTYAKDHLVMKWNQAWDDCNKAGNDDTSACAGAWTTNEWNGMTTGGSQTSEHYKIVWVGSDAEASPYWVDGGYSIWGSYEVVFDQGVANGQHATYTLATPNGLGQNKK